MTRVPCSWCDGSVRIEDTDVIETTETITGPGIAKRACIDCQRSKGLVPLRAYTRRRSAPSIPSAPASGRTA